MGIKINLGSNKTNNSKNRQGNMIFRIIKWMFGLLFKVFEKLIIYIILFCIILFGVYYFNPQLFFIIFG